MFVTCPFCWCTSATPGTTCPNCDEFIPEPIEESLAGINKSKIAAEIFSDNANQGEKE